MTGSRDQELLARIEELEARIAPTAPSGRRRAVPRRARRVILAAVALAGLLVVPVGVFANHQFTDVPNSNTFHGNIGRAKDAGITSGCSPTLYCPNDTVTRGQMAAFLTRSAGRAGFSGTFGSTVTTTDAELYAATIKAGDVSGGQALVVVQAWINAYVSDNVTGCPCAATFYITDGTNGSVLPSVVAVDTLNYTPGSSSYGFAQATISWVMPVPTGTTREISVMGQVTDGSKTFSAFGTVVATYVPFSGDGSAAVSTATEIEGDLVPFGD